MKHQTTRRQFMTESSTAAAVTVSTLGSIPAFAAGAAETVHLGIIGCGGIMTHHVKGLVERKDAAEITWLCDVDQAQTARMAGFVTDGFQKSAPQRTQKFEDVLTDRNVDAVIIATPHHWHAPIALEAMAEGKDVYIEKPISHVYNEGLEIIKASKKYKRVVQQGSQMRSSPVTAKAAKLLQDGIIGEIKVARAWTAENRDIVKPVADSQPPSGVLYDRWLGPAP
ncbi:MAG: Gfo/Idh/MocA family oxidoreductase, partial [Planctomycetaceae bacterium]